MNLANRFLLSVLIFTILIASCQLQSNNSPEDAVQHLLDAIENQDEEAFYEVVDEDDVHRSYADLVESYFWDIGEFIHTLRPKFHIGCVE